MKQLALVLLIAVLFTLTAQPTGGTPPRAKSYAVTLMLIDPPDGPLEVIPVCLRFTAKEMCTTDGNCGSWEFVEKARNQNEWRGALEFQNEDGVTINAALRGITERAGAGNSIGGTVLYKIGDFAFNGSFSGVRVSRSACVAFEELANG